jgi:membrane-associated phospholipid phosphatase
LNTDYFLNILSDTKYIFLSPLRWQARDWLKASLVLGTTGAFFALDNEIQDFVQDERNGTTDDIADIFEPFGNGGYTFGGLAGFYLYGHFFENTKAERTALLAVESFAVTGIFTFALKFSTGRVRPQSARDSGEWNGPNLDDVSFPSGHTSSAFAIATVFASEYKNVPWVPPVAYGLATLTGLSRLNDNKHWASDVFLGGALGYFISKTILKLHSNKKGRHYTIYPRISKKEVGLDFAMRF